MSVIHFKARMRDRSQSGFCGRIGNRFAYSADEVTCKWCLRKLTTLSTKDAAAAGDTTDSSNTTEAPPDGR